VICAFTIELSTPTLRINLNERTIYRVIINDCPIVGANCNGPFATCVCLNNFYGLIVRNKKEEEEEEVEKISHVPIAFKLSSIPG
jgi:hypothetical protein